MWIYTSNGFISVVKPADHAEEDTLVVRSRLKQDILQLFPDAKIIETPMRDYQFRAFLPAQTVADAIGKQILTIGYDNFKNTVADPRRHSIYGRIWACTWELQDDAERHWPEGSSLNLL
jgi:hypothetical protein